jgi:hypothetical protein
MEALGEGLKMFLELHNHKNSVWGFELVWIFMCSLIGLPTLFPQAPHLTQKK